MAYLQFAYDRSDADHCYVLWVEFCDDVLGCALMVDWFACGFSAVISCETDDIDDASWSRVGAVFYCALAGAWCAAGYVVFFGCD